MFSENAVKVDKIFKTLKNKVFLKNAKPNDWNFCVFIKNHHEITIPNNPKIPFDKEKGMLDSKNFTTFFYSLNKLSENEYYASVAIEKIFFKIFVPLYLLFYRDLAYLQYFFNWRSHFVLNTQWQVVVGFNLHI